MVHAAGLGLALFALWLLLSGYFLPLLLGLGVASCVVIVWILHRMDAIDHESFPIRMQLRGLTYWPWLMKEIVKSNLTVAGIILNPRLPISPTVRPVRASQATDMGRVIYANSITLTPGTISVHMADEEILVHALTRDGAESFDDPDMDRRVTRLEGPAA